MKRIATGQETVFDDRTFPVRIGLALRNDSLILFSLDAALFTMSLGAWIICYLANLGFWLWVRSGMA
ncbi:MAG TPA: hypothetical protein VEI58_03550 [Chthoniobacterales bacterium]|nr:hypothetical protein [Chthoniobacterales bacterium]